VSASHILVVDDEPDIGALVKEILEDEGFEVSVADTARAARQARRARRPDLTLLDIWMPDTDGVTLLKEWAEGSGLDSPVIMMSGHGTVETAVEATRLGAYDFLEKPLSIAKLLLTVRHALEASQLRQENIDHRRQHDQQSEPVGRSAVMQGLREKLRRIAQHDTQILITGESGSGKEVCARYLHAHSRRHAGPFVRVSVASMSASSSAAELFGAEEGDEVLFGWLERANGGTLLLEDVADMDVGLQARLLGALQHGSFLREGGVEPVQFNARVVAATRLDLPAAVAAGSFREDLYYHLNVVPLHVPPLREHREDIPELLEHYVNTFSARENLAYRRFSVAAQNRLRNYRWPGNVRELKNLVQRLLILGGGSEIEAGEVDAALGEGVAERAGAGGLPGLDLPLKDAREQFERLYLENKLKETGGNITRLAALVGLERTHLYRKLRALGIDPKRAASAD